MSISAIEPIELSQEEIDSISGAGWSWENAAFGTAVGAQIGGAVSGGNGTAIVVGSAIGGAVGGSSSSGGGK